MVSSPDCERWITLIHLDDFSAISVDGKFGIHIPCRHLQCLMSMCSGAGEMETGGILIGKFDEARLVANITGIYGPPNDSKQTRNRFWRGVEGLQALLDRAWQSQEYYMGEWHYHPMGSSQPSFIDIGQMERISKSDKYNCPEPILLVIGGVFPESMSIAAYVFPRGQDSVQLI